MFIAPGPVGIPWATFPQDHPISRSSGLCLKHYNLEEVYEHRSGAKIQQPPGIP